MSLTFSSKKSRFSFLLKPKAYCFFIGLLVSFQQVEAYCSLSWQQDQWLVDKGEVDSIYDRARYYSNREPIQAGKELQNLIRFIDDPLLNKYPDSTYLKRQKAISQHFLAYFKRRENKFDEALDLYLKSLALKKEIRDTLSVPITLNQLGLLWMYQKQYDHAEEYLLEALKLSKEYNLQSEMLSVLSNLGTLYRGKEDYEMAETYHLQAIDQAHQMAEPSAIAATNNDYIPLLIELEKYSEAVPFIKESININRQTENKIGLESSLFNMGMVYRYLGKPREAIAFYTEAVELSNQLHSKALLPSRYQGLSLAYRDAGDPAKAMDVYIQYQKAKEEREDLEMVKKMAELEAEYEFSQQRVIDSLNFERNRELSEARITERNNRVIFLMLLIGIVIISALIIIYLNKRKNALQIEKDVLQKTKENYELSLKINAKETQVNELLSETAQHIKDKENLASNIKKVIAQEEGADLKSILADLRISKLEDDKRKIFKDRIMSSSPEFLSRLKRAHPDLSKTDLEICNFEKAGLTRAEMANLRGTTLEAIKSNRYRLKKKLGLDASQSLKNYLAQL